MASHLPFQPADNGTYFVINKKAAPTAPPEDDAVSMLDRESHPVDLSVMAQISGGDRSIEIRMLRAFHISNEADTAALKEAIDREDILAVAGVSHRLMGAGRIAGAKALSDICAAIERAALAGDWRSVADNSDACYRELERVKSYIRTAGGI